VSDEDWLPLPSFLDRVLLRGTPDARLDLCRFRIIIGRDSADILIRSLPSIDDARAAFATHGRNFTEPALTAFVQHHDGTVDSYPATPVPPQVIVASESIPNLGDESYLWKGYGNNLRGVVKFRAGQFIVELNAPSEDAVRKLANRIAGLLDGRHMSP
jgi:hypothetical protein